MVIHLKEKNKLPVCELYNLTADVAERKDLADTNGHKVKRLQALMKMAKFSVQHPQFNRKAAEQ
jgi:hypothetical protein